MAQLNYPWNFHVTKSRSISFEIGAQHQRNQCQNFSLGHNFMNKTFDWSKISENWFHKIIHKFWLCHHKMVDNLKWPLLTALATINGTVSKIVTKTEILALVSLLLDTYFIWYWPKLGDIQPNNHLLILFQQNRSSSPS